MSDTETPKQRTIGGLAGGTFARIKLEDYDPSTTVVRVVSHNRVAHSTVVATPKHDRIFVDSNAPAEVVDPTDFSSYGRWGEPRHVQASCVQQGDRVRVPPGLLVTNTDQGKTFGADEQTIVKVCEVDVFDNHVAIKGEDLVFCVDNVRMIEVERNGDRWFDEPGYQTDPNPLEPNDREAKRKKHVIIRELEDLAKTEARLSGAGFARS